MLDLAPAVAGPLRSASGLTMARRWTTAGIDPLDGVSWSPSRRRATPSGGRRRSSRRPSPPR